MFNFRKAFIKVLLDKALNLYMYINVSNNEHLTKPCQCLPRCWASRTIYYKIIDEKVSNWKKKLIWMILRSSNSVEYWTWLCHKSSIVLYSSHFWLLLFYLEMAIDLLVTHEPFICWIPNILTNNRGYSKEDLYI